MTHRLTSKIARIGILTASASIIFVVESWVPSPFPWLKLGLANAMTLLALRWWGIREGLLVVILRVMIGTMLAGTLFQPAFFLAMSGGIAAAVVMYAAIRLFPRVFSPVGLSILGALSKNIVQIEAANRLFIHQPMVWSLLPFFLFTSLLTGFCVGLLAGLIDEKVERIVPV
jgi:heptaprenyl diphosphate synthase